MAGFKLPRGYSGCKAFSLSSLSVLYLGVHSVGHLHGRKNNLQALKDLSCLGSRVFIDC